MEKILVLHGPNLNLLGTREPEIYGRTTLDDVNQMIAARAKEAGIGADFLHENCSPRVVESLLDEGALVRVEDRYRIPENRFFVSDEIIRELI